ILYPNPNSGRFNIRINSVLYNNLGMRVYTNEGTLVRTQQFSGLAWGRVIPIDLSHLPGGLYMIKFYYEGGPRTAEKTLKVIIGTE
ncbi:MAG TPA: T9SS type A sorting domain-containing protein, partial [Chitinophagaceae bacterium]|nr:T9SS type A sorting domain-containing protein [Chitinophagaceae bacterium]